MNLDTDSANTLNADQTKIATGSEKRLRAIVVDDSPTFIEIVCALLELDGQVDIVGRASSSTEAFEAIAQLRPDLVLIDVDMPPLDGLSATVIISSCFPSIRIILMSADESESLRRDALACGASSFIYKPRFREEFSCALRSSECRQHLGCV